MIWSINEPIAKDRAVKLQYVPITSEITSQVVSALYNVKCNNQRVLTGTMLSIASNVTDILSPYNIVMMSLAGVHAVFILLLAAGFIVFRSFKAIRRAAPVISIVMSVGAIFASIGVLLLALPPTVPVCYLNIWFCGIGFVVFFSYVFSY